MNWHGKINSEKSSISVQQTNTVQVEPLSSISKRLFHWGSPLKPPLPFRGPPPTTGESLLRTFWAGLLFGHWPSIGNTRNVPAGSTQSVPCHYFHGISFLKVGNKTEPTQNPTRKATHSLDLGGISQEFEIFNEI